MVMCILGTTAWGMVQLASIPCDLIDLFISCLFLIISYYSCLFLPPSDYLVLLVTGYVCLRAYLMAFLLNSEHLYCNEVYISFITSGKEMTYFDVTVHTSISPSSSQEHGRGSKYKGLPWWLRSKQSTCNAGNAGDAGSIPGSGRYPRERNGSPLQYSCLENSMDRAAWRATVPGVGKSQTQLSN